MTEKLWTFDAVVPGQRGRATTVHLSAADVAEYAATHLLSFESVQAAWLVSRLDSGGPLISARSGLPVSGQCLKGGTTCSCLELLKENGIDGAVVNPLNRFDV